MISSRLDPSLPPNFSELDEYKFQRMCRDLMTNEEDISVARVYGKRGQKQFGIDILAKHKRTSAHEVAQCKKYEKVTALQIKEASDEFLKEDVWKKRSVLRFILFVACDLEDAKLQDQEIKEQQRFKERGILYEIWSGDVIWTKLRQHQNLVQLYCGEYWVRKVFGMPQPPPQVAQQGQTAVRTSELLNLLGPVISELAEEKEKALDEIRNLSAEGKPQEALEKIIALCAKPTWPMLPAEMRGKALRVQASLTLAVRKDVETAERLLKEAQTAYPGGSTLLLETLLAHRKRGPEAALKLLTSPATIEEYNVRMRLLLELGRPKEALKIVQNIPPTIRPNHDTAWARAMALLLTKQIDEARTEIESALNRRPRDFALRQAYAVINYASVVSTVFPAWGHLTWPVPPDLDFLKRDDVSRQRLVDAGAIFSELAKLTTGDERLELLVWRMACLANCRETQDEALALVQQILSDSPAFVPAIVWASTREWPFNSEASMAALHVRITKEDADLDEFIALLDLIARRGAFDQAVAFWNTCESTFTHRGKQSLWLIHKVQILAALDKFNEVDALLRTEQKDDQREELDRKFLAVVARSTGDFSKMAAYLESRFEKTKSLQDLIECCRAKARISDWPFIAIHGRELVAGLRTEAALRLAVQGAFEAHNYQLCLDLIEENKGLLPASKPSADLRHLVMECQRRIGHLSEAIAEAERLAQEKPEFGRMANLYMLLLEKGDLPACALIARKFLELPNVPPEFLLHIIPTVRHRDPALAEHLWQKARCESELNARAITAAIFHSFALGVEQNATDLLSKMPEIAAGENAPLRMVSIEEALRLFREANEERARVIAHYEKGEVPVHFIASHLSMPLAQVYYDVFLSNQKTKLTSLTPAIFVRHGNRGDGQLTDFDHRSGIFIDITGILLAHVIDLLDSVERHFPVIFISGQMIPSLVSQMTELLPKQPTVIASLKLALDLLRRGKVKTFVPGETNRTDRVSLQMGNNWCASLDQAKRSCGLIVEFWPLTSNDQTMEPVHLPAEDAPFVVSAGDIVRGMADAGIVSASEARTALAKLGRLAIGSGQPANLRVDPPIYLEHRLIGHLAGSGVLGPLVERCDVFITLEEAETLEAEVEAAERASHTHGWLDRLVARVSRGIDSGKYRIHRHPNPKASPEVSTPTDPDELAFFDAVHFGETEGLPVWYDDRSLSAYKTVGRAPLVGIYDVLGHLHEGKALDNNSYFEKLLRLRSGNVRYLPLSKEEIFFHLQRASVEAGRAEESAELGILRRYTASCMLDRSRLQAPVPDANGNINLRELAFPLALNQIIHAALLKLWKESKEPTESIIARANWLWNNLVWDIPAFCNMLGVKTTGIQSVETAGRSIGYLFVLGLQLTSTLSKQLHDISPVRPLFFQWVDEHILRPRLSNSPKLINGVAQAIRHGFEVFDGGLVRDEKTYGKKSTQAIAQRMLISEWISDLPKWLHTELNLPKETLRHWKIKVEKPKATFMNEQFPARRFWTAVAKAVSGGDATIPTLDRKGKLCLTRGPSDSVLRAELMRGSSKRESQLTFMPLPLFGADVSVRKAFLLSHKEWFDCAAEERERQIQRIAETSQPDLRLGKFEEVREASASWFYLELRSNLSQGRLITSDDLILAPKSCEKHLRISHPAALSTSEELQRIATSLLSEEGLEETIVRFSCLPVVFPESLWKAVRVLLPEAKASLFERLQKELITAVQRVHLIALLLEDVENHAVTLPLAKKQIEFLTGHKCRKETAAFRAILNWVNLRYGWIVEPQKWHPATRLRLVWLHASRLYQAFAATGDDAEKVKVWFSQLAREIGREAISPELTFIRDVAYPGNVQFNGLVLFGLASVLEHQPDEVVRSLNAAPLLQALLLDDSNIGIELRPFYQDPALLGNLLDSFLGSRYEETLLRLLGTEIFQKRFVPTPPIIAAQTSLTKLNENPHDTFHWSIVNLILEDVELETALKSHLLSLIERLDYAKAFANDLTAGSRVITLSNRFAALIVDQPLRNRLHQQLARVAHLASKVRAKRSGQLSEDQEYMQLSSCLLDATWQLCRVSAEPAANCAVFSTHASDIVRLWPETAEACREQLSTLFISLPADCHAELWRVIFTLRSLH